MGATGSVKKMYTARAQPSARAQPVGLNQALLLER